MRFTSQNLPLFLNEKAVLHCEVSQIFVFLVNIAEAKKESFDIFTPSSK